MRVNPTHDSTCANRIGMYREKQCTDGPHPCVFLSECDRHYDEKTGDWDYPDPLNPEIQHKAPKRQGRYGSTGVTPRGGVSPVGKTAYQRRWWLVRKGLACWMPIRSTLDQALAEAGL